MIYHDITTKFAFQPIDAECVQKQLGAIQKGKVTGLSNPHTYLLKDASYIIVKLLHQIMNGSLKSGAILSEWTQTRASA